MHRARWSVCSLAAIGCALLAQGAAAATFSIVFNFGINISQFSEIAMSADGSRVAYNGFFSGGGGYDSLGHSGAFVSLPAFSADGSIVMGGHRPSGGDLQLYRRVGATETVIATGATASGVSGDGQRYIGSASGVGAFVADYAAGPQVFTPLRGPGGIAAGVSAISGNGQVIVGGAASQAVRWDATGVTSLGDLAGGAVNSSPSAVSYDGRTIVGRGTSAAGSEAVRWVDGVIESLGLGVGSTALGVSGDGSRIVGNMRFPNEFGSYLYSGGGVINVEVLLADAILAAGFDPNATNLGVSEISADGMIIAGSGAGPSFAAGQQIFIWKAVIPEPSTAVLCASGLVAMTMRRRAER